MYTTNDKLKQGSSMNAKKKMSQSKCFRCAMKAPTEQYFFFDLNLLSLRFVHIVIYEYFELLHFLDFYFVYFRIFRPLKS